MKKTTILLSLILALSATIHAETIHVVKNGEFTDHAVKKGGSWKSENGRVIGSGTGQTLGFAGSLDSKEFTITATLAIEKIRGGAAGIILGKEFFGFDSREGTCFLEQGSFPFESLKKTKGLIKPDKKFKLSIVSKNNTITFSIDGKQLARKPYPNTTLGLIALRPHRNTVKVSRFTITGAIAKREKLNHIFASGEDGYKSYRIPALVTTKNGTLLAFCEGRVHGAGDHGDIDIVMKRSTDNGATWSALQVVHNFQNHCAGNPAPVVDQKSGRVFLVSCTSSVHEGALNSGKGRRGITIQHSDDDGKTWTEPRDISKNIYPDNWGWYATGPCSGIQIREGKHAGRLVIPANHGVVKNGRSTYRAHSIYSDDLGKTWQLGASSEPGGNESQIAEAGENLLYQTVRMQSHSKGVRAFRYSKDGGESWSDLKHDKQLPCPRCQGSVIRDYSQPSRLIFSNPGTKNGRNGMTIRVSEDGGKTWPHAKLVRATSSAYSDLAIMSNKKIAILYEGGHHAYANEGIVFAAYTMQELLRSK